MQTSHQPVSALGRIWLALLGLVILVAGGFFAFQGFRLLSLGGSAYFVVAGVVLLLSGVQIARARPSGALLFGAVLLGTLVWAVLDAGWSFWPLVSRVLTLAGVALLVALSYPLMRRARGLSPAKGPALVVAAVLAVGGGATL